MAGLKTPTNKQDHGPTRSHFDIIAFVDERQKRTKKRKGRSSNSINNNSNNKDNDERDTSYENILARGEQVCKDTFKSAGNELR